LPPLQKASKDMAFDDISVDLDVDNRVRDSFNTTTTNTANIAADIDNVGNTDNSTHDNSENTLGVTDSFHWDSHNTDTDTDDSGNTGSYNDSVEVTDNSVDDHSDNSTHDNSVNAGVREYNTGFGNVAGLGGGGGDSLIANRSTILDQSVNTNIATGGGVAQWVSTEAVVNSGDGAIVAGDDADVEYNVDGSMNISAGGDVLIDSDKTVETAVGSYNTTSVEVNTVDNSQEWDLENVGNSYSHTVDIDNSFNDELTAVSTSDWDVDANVIWDSEIAGIADDVDVDIDLP
jgi:hypothetical protein